MRLAGILAASTALLLVLGASPSCHGAANHNITDILAAHPDLTEFSAALSSTGAAALIDSQTPVTVLAVGNAVMAQLKAQKLQPKDLEHVIYLHVLYDYLDFAKLRTLKGGSVQSTSLYQAAGKARAAEGMVSVTVASGGRVAFALSDNPTATPAAVYQQSVKELPYDIAVLQVSAPIWSPAQAAGAPAPAPPAQAPTPPALPPVVAPATPPTPVTPPTPASSPASAPTPPALAPVVAPATPPTPVSSPASAPAPPALAPASPPASADAPAPPALAPPAVAPATAPTPRRRPAPAPEDILAPSPDADTEPAADEKNSAARDTASWSLGTAVAAAVPAIVLLLLW